MAQLTVRNLDESVKAGLRSRAKRHGHSMEEEARNILSAATKESSTAPKNFGTWVANLVAGNGLKEPIEEHRGDLVKPAIFK
jgi:plasmid stability protein